MEISLLELDQELSETKNELAQVRDRLNSITKQYHDTMQEYKKEYAIAYLEAKNEGRTNGECEMIAQKKTAELQARYKSMKEHEKNERKAVDSLIEKAELLRSLYSRAQKEEEQYYRKGK